MQNEKNMTQSAGGVVLNAKGEVLVVNQNRNSWSLPKGRINDGEEALAAARREIHEESGLTELEYVKGLGAYERTQITLDGRDDDPTQPMRRIHMFLFKTRQTSLEPIDPENPEARWVARSDVAKLLTHRKDREFFESILGQL